MSSLLLLIMIVAMASVLAVLALGLFSMVKGGEFNRKYGNRLMQARVYLQGIALAALALAFLASQK